MTSELKWHLLSPYSFILQNTLKENWCSIPTHPQMAGKYTSEFPRLECTDAQENVQVSSVKL
jgi:hypothetical protein